jgi:hypothetical protein
MDEQGGIEGVVKQHPALVIGGVVLVGTLILVSRKSGSNSKVGQLDPSQSYTMVSADTLNNALAAQREDILGQMNTQRSDIEAEIQDFYERFGRFPQASELQGGVPAPPAGDPSYGAHQPGPPGPFVCAPGYYRDPVTGQCVQGGQGGGGTGIDLDAPGSWVVIERTGYRYGL